MSRRSQLAVFSDLDGTLLDHDTYAWDEARVAIEALRRQAIPLVLVSSKTRAEILELRAALDNEHPYVVENGAATYVPSGYFADLGQADAGAEHCISAGPGRCALANALSRARRDHGYRFTSFAEMGTAGIVRNTGLTEAAAAAANDRAASEPLLWQDTESRLAPFAEALGADGLRCVRGGRFVHVMGQFDKAGAVAQLTRLFANKYETASIVTVALGDGPNDLAMLAQADIAVVVKGKHEHAMPLKTPHRVIRTALPGPAGWREAVLGILSDYEPAP